MSTKSLGKVTVTPRGEWDAAYAYKRLDIVSGSGASWICIADTTAGTAVTDADHWMKLAGKGEDLKVVSSEKTGTSGAVDTYTLTFTFSDDSTDTVTYTVTNGSVTSVAGKTGAVTLGAGDVGYDATASYTSATVGGEVSALKSAIANTNDSLLNFNSIPVNVEFIDISQSIITQAQNAGVALAVTGANKFTLNGVATSLFTIPIDYEKIRINGAETLYYFIGRSDGVNRQDGVRLAIGYFDAIGDAHSTTKVVDVFNQIDTYTYSSDAVSTRNYLRVPSGASFDNVEFAVNIMRSKPLDASVIDKADSLLLADKYSNIPLAWESATGYWANNKTFATYNNIYTATVDVTNGEKYLLDARSYYGMCIGVYYSGDTITADSIVDIIHLSNDDTWHYKYETQVPKDAEHLLLQQYYNISRATIRKIEKNAIIKSSLSGKTIAYDGDSIAESRLTGNAANGGAYPYLIAEATGCFFVNEAISGGILASAVPSGTMPHSVVNSLGQLPNDADLYCIEGGVNDFWRDVPLGDYSQTDYSATVDTTTVCGALEHIIRSITYYHVGKPLVFVLVHKATATINPNNAGYTFDQMREKMIGILNKYAIPYYDAYLYSGLNGYNSIQSTTFLTANSSGQGDGIHPNEAGYRRYYVPQLISLFESLMPVLTD